MLYVPTKTVKEPFLDPGVLKDEDLELVLVETRFGDIHPFVPQYRFEMRHVPSGTRAGNIDLRTSLTSRLEEYGGHIGYNVDPEYRGSRYSARSCRLLFPLARAHNINPILITCSPDNLPSVKTCEAIGAHLVKQQEVEVDNNPNRLTSYYHIEL